MATLKNTTIDDTGYLELPIGTLAQRPTPEQGMIRYASSSVVSSIEYYNGTNWVHPSNGVRSDGLMFHVDAANSSSYPGSGAIWYDISGNKYDTIIYGSSPWSSSYYGGSMNLSNSNTQYLEHSAACWHNLQHRRKWSVEIWLQPTASTAAGQYMWSTGPFSNTNGYIIGFDTTTIVPYQMDLISGAHATWTSGVPMQYVLVHDDLTTYAYKNGALVGTYDYNTTAPERKTIDFTSFDTIVFDEETDTGVEGIPGGFAVDQDYIGIVSVVRMYGRILSSAEVSTNYNELRSRFGLS